MKDTITQPFKWSDLTERDFFDDYTQQKMMEHLVGNWLDRD